MADLITVPFSASGIGANVVIAGNSNIPTIQIMGIFFQCGIATILTMKAGTTALTGPMTFVTGGGFTLPPVGSEYFQCNNADDFIFTFTGLTGSAHGSVKYFQF